MSPDLNMLPNVSEDLKRQIVTAIASGRKRLLIWGFNETCIELLIMLNASGIAASYIAGIIDPDPQKQGDRLFGHEVLHSDQLLHLEFDTLIITSDREKEVALRTFAHVNSSIPEVIISGTGHLEFHDPEFESIASSCLVKSYANGYPYSLIHIFQSIKYLAAAGIRGDVAEFGIFKGGTVVFIAKTLAHFGFEQKIFGFDIFDGFPSRKSVLDMYSNPKCEFRDYNAVEQYCKTNGIEVVKGDICETHAILDGSKLMLSFFDTDNYSPTQSALGGCFERTVSGGIIAFDHYVSDSRFLYTIGERMAANEVLMNKRMFNLHGTGVFLKL